MKQWFVYQHAANGEVFYVGCGTGKRPYSKNRSHLWKTHVASVGTYDVQIVGEFTSHYDALQCEDNLIMKLRPKCNGKTLPYGKRVVADEIVTMGFTMLRSQREAMKASARAAGYDALYKYMIDLGLYGKVIKSRLPKSKPSKSST